MVSKSLFRHWTTELSSSPHIQVKQAAKCPDASYSVKFESGVVVVCLFVFLNKFRVIVVD